MMVPERYVALALALGEHVEGLTFFYGDDRRVRQERSNLLAEADCLLGELGEVEPEPRRRWLERQVRALRAVAADEPLAVRDEARVLARSSPRCQRWSSRPRLPSGASRLWSGPATKPSSEIDMWQVVSGIGVLSKAVCDLQVATAP
jgi:hypothetical protein